MTTLIRHRIVLSAVDPSGGEFEDAAENKFKGIEFGSEGAFCAAGDRSHADHIKVILPRLIWVEMGEPTVITVAVTPGDDLNGDLVSNEMKP